MTHTGIDTPSLHDALPIYRKRLGVAARKHEREEEFIPDEHEAEGDGADEGLRRNWERHLGEDRVRAIAVDKSGRSEEHTSELQSPCNLVCRLLLEKKNTK